MQISPVIQNNFSIKNNFKKQNKNQNSANQNKNIELTTNPMFYPLSFGAMKKNQFSGFDLVAIEKFKLPIQKFNSNDDLQNYCLDLIEENYIQKEFPARTQQGEIQRKAILGEWIEYIKEENKEYSPSTQLLIFDFITKGLIESTDKLPPKLNKGALASCICDVQENLKANPKYSFNLSKLYTEKLKELYLGSSSTATCDSTGWIIIPSKENDPENFNNNVDKLKALSHDNWCTKTFNAEPYLSKGDFHIYMENGKPKLGIRFEKDEIVEIQGEQNDGQIPLDYLEIAKEHTADMSLSEAIKEDFILAQRKKEIIPQIRQQLATEIENKDYKAILEFFGSKVDYDEDGMLVVETFKDWIRYDKNLDISLSEVMNEDEITRKIVEFKGDVVLSGKAVDFSNLKKVNGSLSADWSALKSLNSLEYIGKDALLSFSDITSMKNLKYIGGDARFDESKIKNLDSLEYIGGVACFSKTDIEHLDALKSIGDDAWFEESAIKSMKNLEIINGSAWFSGSEIENLDNLTTVGGGADFSYTKIKHLDKLRKINGHGNFSHSKIETLDGLEEIKYALHMEDNSLRSMNSLKHLPSGMYFKCSKMESMASLETISGMVDFSGAKIKNFPNLRKIDGDACFSGCEISSLENLEEIEGNADFSKAKFIYSKDPEAPRPLNNLKVIHGNADFSHSSIQTLRRLQEIEGDANFSSSRIRFLRGLKRIGGDADFRNVKTMVYREGKAHPLKNLQEIGGEIFVDNSRISIGDFFNWGEPNCKEIRNGYDDVFLVLEIAG
ncbi:MAG: hypothetical protein IJW73_08295 [Candidatus Gastranaerophilales bacterium]|nr:hypothetical protein [Candidatus Gastranaerophilales bacterium]